MEKTYSYVLFIEPKAKKRPKVYRWSTVNPSQDDEELAARIFKELDDIPKEPLSGQIRVQFLFYKSPPKNTPKWKLPYMDRGLIRPNKSPDLDNYIKLILDALNGVLWADDRYIVEMHAGKFYTTQKPRIEIIVNQIPEFTKKNLSIIVEDASKYDNLGIFFDFR